MVGEGKIFSRLPEALLPWYHEHKRELPWRQDREPYHIWLSEIMLQQTRVEAVKGYYARFLDAIPDIRSLSEADDELLHKLWEGLGYYSRVRNLKKAAIAIQTQHSGVFPREYKDVLSLPGIGEYTAGAICSIAFDQPTPAVDGNVLRVVSRLTDDETPVDMPSYKAAVARSLASVYPQEAGSFTQALMELGATVCGPNRKPECENCPCKVFCLACRRGTAEQLPVKLPKRERRQEDRTVFILSCDGRFAIQKRPGKGLLAGLWQYPNVAGRRTVDEAIKILEEMGMRPREILKQVRRRHIFTHVQWDMDGIYMEVAEPAGDFTWLTAQEIRESAALPTAFRLFFEENEQ